MKRTITIKPDGTITIEESVDETPAQHILIVPRETTADTPIVPLPHVVPPAVPIAEPIWRVFPPGWPGTFTW